MEETLVAVNNAGLDRFDGNVGLGAVDTTASDPRASGGKSLGAGNKAIRSSQDQVSWLLREGRGIRKERLAIDSQLSTQPYIPGTLPGAPNPVRPKTL